MLKFHPYSILTGETIVEFVIYCVSKLQLVQFSSLIVQRLEKYEIRILRMPGHTVLTAKSDPYHLPSVPYIVAARMSAIFQ